MRKPFFLMVIIATSILATSSQAVKDDPIRIKLDAGKLAYDADLEKFRKSVLEFLDKKDEAARKAGNKLLVDQIKIERSFFEETGLSPVDLPAMSRDELALARVRLDTEFHTAIRQYLVTKQDSDAVDVEKAWKLLKVKEWQEFNIDETRVIEDGLRLGKERSIFTIKEYSGAIEVFLVARTDAENIRIHAYQGACVIFNWEVNPKELRVCRPDGKDARESGSIISAKVAPLKPKVWHRIKWIITSKGMKVYADEQLLFAEVKNYDLSKKQSIAVASATSAIDVKQFRITSIPEK